MGYKGIKPAFLAVYFIFFASGLFAAGNSIPGVPDIGVSGKMDWEKGELSVTAEFNIGQAGIRFPSGRNQAEEILGSEYLGFIKPLLFSLQADSSSTVEDLVNRGELSQQELDGICLAAQKTPPNFTADLTRFSGSYTVKQSMITAALIRHSRAGEPIRPVIPSPAANYTGIIIVADTMLPIHGRNTSALLNPCLFPKIWDSEMNLIYEKNLTDPQVLGSGERNMVQYIRSDAIYKSTPSGLDPELVKLVGDRPLKIFAGSIYGLVPTDPVIDRDDALVILSNDNNRRLLRDGKIAFVINENMLSRALP